MNLPTNYTTVWVTYIANIRYGPYKEKVKREKVTRRGFYVEDDGKFSIPPSWRPFNGVMSPHGFGGDRITPEQVIKWEYCND